MTTSRNNPGRPSRRRFIAGSAAALTAGMIGAPAVRAQSAKTLRFLNNETSADSMRALKIAAAEYEKASGVKVVIDSVTTEATFTKLSTSIRSGQPYDIAGLQFPSQVMLLAGQGHLVPLDGLTSKYQWGPDLSMSMNGKTYYYPYDYNFSWVYYRKDLYASKGLSVPATWDQLLANSQALTGDGVSGSLFPIGANPAANWLSTGFLWADGVTLFDDQWNVTLDAAASKARTARYLDFMAALYKTMPPGASQASFSEVISNFVSGKVAHAPYAGRIIETLDRNAPNLADKFGIMPFVDSAGKTKAVCNATDGWVVLKSEHSEEALKFMEWFTENHYINFLHTAPLHFQPARLDVYDDPRWKSNPLIRKYADVVQQMRTFATDPDIIRASIDTQGPAPDLRPGKVFESFAVPEMLENRCLKNLPAEQCVQIAADKIRKLIA